ncbi:MAG: hypothetical protein K2P81_08165 [Bacteriovoracaceae bacterium]|nr:hypothetical protein [Bacteriovoracaceae bacterium]
MKILFLLLFSFNSLAQNSTTLPQEKELDVVDFQNVKDVLKKDGLMQEVQKKKKEVLKIKEIRSDEEKKLYNWPTDNEFWPIATEYWLVKQAPTLMWDFDRPDYGLTQSFASILKTVGYIQKRFRLLAIDSPSPAHLSLPWTSDELCLVFSVPFARSMDLSKLEISLLLLEDVLRMEEGWLKDFATPANLKDLLGSNFKDKKPDLTPIFEVSKGYTKFIQEKGFSFQQQFTITKKMSAILKPHPELWNAYVRLLGKIDRLVKGNQVFSSYVKLYPSPEMQIRWLAPEEKIL